MKKETLSDAISRLDTELINEYFGSKDAETPRRKVSFPRVAAIAAAVLLLAGGAAVYVIAAEAKEYGEALEFFTENGIPTDGLSRSEIKAVYKDVTMKTYSYEKTLEILSEYRVEVQSETVETQTDTGIDEHRDELFTEYFERIRAQSGIKYGIAYGDTVSAGTANEHPVQYVVKSDGETELWRYLVPDDVDYLTAEDNIAACGDSVAVFGSTGGSPGQTVTPFAMMLNADGDLLWRYDGTKEGFRYQAACDCGDAVAFFGGGVTNDGFANVFTLIGKDGEVRISRVDKADRYIRYGAAVKAGDHYLAKVFDEDWKVISVSENGEKTEQYDYSFDGVPLMIKDVISCGGKVYLSAEKKKEDLTAELMEKFAADEEALLRFFRENYTAILLETGDDGTVRKAFETANVRPGTLTADEDGNLCWQIIRYDSGHAAPPYLSSHRYEFNCTEFAFVFGEDGKLKEKIEVGYYPSDY